MLDGWGPGRQPGSCNKVLCSATCSCAGGPVVWRPCTRARGARVISLTSARSSPPTPVSRAPHPPRGIPQQPSRHTSLRSPARAYRPCLASARAWPSQRRSTRQTTRRTRPRPPQHHRPTHSHLQVYSATLALAEWPSAGEAGRERRRARSSAWRTTTSRPGSRMPSDPSAGRGAWWLSWRGRQSLRQEGRPWRARAICVEIRAWLVDVLMSPSVARARPAHALARSDRPRRACSPGPRRSRSFPSFTHRVHPSIL